MNRGKLERTSITKQEDFGQASEFYTRLTQIGKEHLAENLASDLKIISDDIKKKVMEYFNKVSSDLAKRIESEMKKMIKGLKNVIFMIKMTFFCIKFINFRYVLNNRILSQILQLLH